MLSYPIIKTIPVSLACPVHSGRSLADKRYMLRTSQQLPAASLNLIESWLPSSQQYRATLQSMLSLHARMLQHSTAGCPEGDNRVWQVL